jgi:hypothetical protein
MLTQEDGRIASAVQRNFVSVYNSLYFVSSLMAGVLDDMAAIQQLCEKQKGHVLDQTGSYCLYCYHRAK